MGIPANPRHSQNGLDLLLLLLMLVLLLLLLNSTLGLPARLDYCSLRLSSSLNGLLHLQNLPREGSHVLRLPARLDSGPPLFPPPAICTLVGFHTSTLPRSTCRATFGGSMLFDVTNDIVFQAANILESFTVSDYGR